MKSKNRLITTTICIFLSACSHQQHTTNNPPDSLKTKTNKYQEPDVSLIRLIANPNQNDGRKVRVIGYLNLEFEGNALYLNKSDYDQSISKNALWVQLSIDSANLADIKKCSGNYVIMEGTFSTTEGHMGLFSGSIENITRIQIWTPVISVLKPKKIANYPHFPPPAKRK